MRSVVYWAVGLVLCRAILAWGGALTIVARPTAVVQGPQITIGDIAEVHGGSPSVAARVRSIVIGQSPPAGQERVLYGSYIGTRLKQYEVHVRTVQIHTPVKIRVARAAQRLASRDIEAAVIHAIRSQMPWPAQQTTIQRLRGIKPVILPPGPVRTEVTFPVHTDFLGPTSFTVVFWVAGSLEKRLYGTADIDVTQEVVTTQRPLARHERITAGDISLRRVHLARLPRHVFMKPDEVIGKRTKRPLQAHAVIHTYEVEPIPLVRKGDVVLILVESPLLKVSTIGEALDAGQRGDTIRVRNVSSQREIRAVVVNNKTVRVPF